MRFSERVSAGPLWWLEAGSVAIIFGIMFLPVSQTLSISAAIIAGLIGFIALYMASYRITITDSKLQVGRAAVELKYLKNPQAIAAQEWSSHLGHSDDRTIFAVTRPWIRTGVLVELDDPRDPVKKWLIGSRSPQRMVDQIRAYAAHSEQTGIEFSS